MTWSTWASWSVKNNPLFPFLGVISIHLSIIKSNNTPRNRIIGLKMLEESQQSIRNGLTANRHMFTWHIMVMFISLQNCGCLFTSCMSVYNTPISHNINTLSLIINYILVNWWPDHGHQRLTHTRGTKSLSSHLEKWMQHKKN